MNSRFLNINEYCLIEYIYNDTSVQEDCNLYLIDNMLSNSHQIYNSNSDDVITYNIQDYTVVPYGNNRYVQLDEENDIIAYSNDLIKSNLISTTSFYDTVRFHFISGMDISKYTGIILGVRHTENSGKINNFASILLNSLNYSDLIQYNSKPIYLSESIYNTYIEIKILSIDKLNQSYYSVSPKDPDYNTILRTKLASQITLYDVTDTNSNFSGFINQSPILFTLDECNSTDLIKTNDTTFTIYKVDNHKEASLPQVNNYEKFNLTISEALDGNYFVYYAMYDNGFPAEFINLLSQNNESWVLIHQLNVFEHTQHGGTFQTSTLTTYQSNNFDEPQYFRPILKNSGIDVSFDIDYMVRLLNQNTGEQIIRTGSVSSYNVNRYGRNTIGINMQTSPESHKIYNRVFKSPISQTDIFIDPDFNNSINYNSTITSNSNIVIDKIVRYPLYVDFNKISVADKAIYENVTNLSNIIYKQGDLRIILKPFDMYLKFRLYQESGQYAIPLSLDSMNIYRIVFLTSMNNKIVYESTSDESSRLSNGDLIFKLPESDVLKILSESIRDFYITSYNYSTLQESILYSGFWFNQSEKSLYDSHIKLIKSEYQSEKEKQNALNSVINYNVIETIPSEIEIPGYVDQNKNNNEISPLLKMKPKS